LRVHFFLRARHVYVFVSPDGEAFGFSLLEDGGNLPMRAKPWQPHALILMSQLDIGASPWTDYRFEFAITELSRRSPWRDPLSVSARHPS
jgi:hypothetical protein